MTKSIYDSDGLCVTPTTYTTRAGEMPRDGLTVEVTVVGGEWLLSERDAARLHTALGEWLEKANLRRWPACESPMPKTVPGWSTLGEIGDAIADRVVERLAAREDQAHPEAVVAIAAKESMRADLAAARRAVAAVEADRDGVERALDSERRAHAAAREQIAAYERALAGTRAQRDEAAERLRAVVRLAQLGACQADLDAALEALQPGDLDDA